MGTESENFMCHPEFLFAEGCSVIRRQMFVNNQINYA